MRTVSLYVKIMLIFSLSTQINFELKPPLLTVVIANMSTLPLEGQSRTYQNCLPKV